MLAASAYSATCTVEISERKSSRHRVPCVGLTRFSCPKMVLHPAVARARIDTCYLDTTYLNPKYCFPPQPQVIEACATLARRTVVGLSETAPPLQDAKEDIKPDVYGATEYHQEKSKEMMQGWLVKKEDSDMDVKQEPITENGVKSESGDHQIDGIKEELKEVKPKPKGRTLVVMGTYSIGKERIVKGKLVVMLRQAMALTINLSRGQNLGFDDILRSSQEGDPAMRDGCRASCDAQLRPHSREPPPSHSA